MMQMLTHLIHETQTLENYAHNIVEEAQNIQNLLTGGVNLIGKRSEGEGKYCVLLVLHKKRKTIGLT